MKKEITVDLLKNASYDAGQEGENLAVELIIHIPKDMYSEDHNYRLVFSNGVVTSMLTVEPPQNVNEAGIIRYMLESGLTTSRTLQMQLEEYDDSGLLDKSFVVTLNFDKSLTKPKEIFLNQDLILEINYNSLARHTHTNLEAVNRITGHQGQSQLYIGELDGGVALTACEVGDELLSFSEPWLMTPFLFVLLSDYENYSKGLYSLNDDGSWTLVANIGGSGSAPASGRGIEFVSNLPESVEDEKIVFLQRDINYSGEVIDFNVSFNNSAVSDSVRNCVVEPLYDDESLPDGSAYWVWCEETIEHPMFGEMQGEKWIKFDGSAWSELTGDYEISGKLDTESINSVNNVIVDVNNLFDVTQHTNYVKGLYYSENNNWHLLTAAEE